MPPESLPVAILLGIYLGLVAGIVPALITGLLGFLFRYLSGITVPAFAVVVLAVAIAGVNGGFLALNESAVRSSPTLVTAVLVVLMIALYAHAQGDKLGAELPRRLSWRRLRDRTLSTDVVELVRGRGQVRVTVTGEVGDIEGAPPLAPAVRTAIREGEWTFPADLPIDALEDRLAERLRSDHDLAEVHVTIDEQGQARVAAAPAAAGLSRRVPAGKRAVSVETLVPTGIARGDEVTVHAGETTVDGVVVSARSGDGGRSVRPERYPAATTARVPHAPGAPNGPTAGADSTPPSTVPETAPAPTTAGGDGRVTVAVDRAAATTLLSAPRGAIVVQARGVRRDLELLSLLHAAGLAIRQVTIAGTTLPGTTIGAANLRGTHDVAVLAVEADGEWVVAPRGQTALERGARCYVVGRPAALTAFAEVAS